MWYHDEHQLWARPSHSQRPEIDILLNSVAVTDGSTAGAWMRATSKVAIRLAGRLIRRLFSVRPAESSAIASALRGHVRYHG